MSKVIKKDNLYLIMKELLRKGRRVIAPARESTYLEPVPIVPEGQVQKGLLLYRIIQSPEEAVLDFFQTAISPKEFLLPATEVLFKFKREKEEIKLEEEEKLVPETVLFGLKPCDAAAFPILDKIFSWDYLDDLYLKRREATTIVGMSCKRADEACFCTSVGLDPESRKGSDLFLIEASESTYVASPVTEKGLRFMEEFKPFFEEGEFQPSRGDEASPRPLAKPQRSININRVKEWLDNHFQGELWPQLLARCLGCGICAFLCPTCHCFDIIDEGRYGEGERRKNWDACSFEIFTLHASGHNPRDVQHKRYRQRIMHKFKYYPDKFGEVLCTGCGRCIRACPVNLDIAEVLDEIGKR